VVSLRLFCTTLRDLVSHWLLDEPAAALVSGVEIVGAMRRRELLVDQPPEPVLQPLQFAPAEGAALIVA
jgi:hypothetical protein